MNGQAEVVPDLMQCLRRGVRNSGVCISYQDPDLAVRLMENPPAAFPSRQDILEHGDAAIFDPSTAAQIVDAKRRVLRTGESARIQAAIRPDRAQPVWFEILIEPDEGPQGIRGIFVSTTEITESREREKTVQALIYEVSHRSRNLLAILQSVLGHTARSCDTIGAFERQFRGRIASLALSQDLITRSEWRGVTLARLVERQLDAVLGAKSPAPPLRGDDPTLTPKAALHIGLALHELAVNSLRSGALASGLKKAAEGMQIEAVTHGPRRVLTWREKLDGRQVEPPSRSFGQTILENIVGRAVGGHVDYQVTPDSLTYRIDWLESSPSPQESSSTETEQIEIGGSLRRDERKQVGLW